MDVRRLLRTGSRAEALPSCRASAPRARHHPASRRTRACPARAQRGGTL